MIDVQVQYLVDEQPTHPQDLTDEYLTELLEHTGEQAARHVHQRLDSMTCEAHQQQPRVMVTARYFRDTEQMELSYHVDSCCQMLLLRAVKALNH